MSCMSNTTQYCSNLGSIAPPIRQRCSKNPFTSISNYRHSIQSSSFNETIETLSCGTSGRGVYKARVPLLRGSVEHPAVLQVNVVSDYVMAVTAGPGMMDKPVTAGTNTEGKGSVEGEEVQVIVRGVVGTNVKVPGPPSSFHANTSLKSEQVFLLKIFDITIPNDSSNSRDNDQPFRHVHSLDPIVIGPSWPSSSVHSQGWVRYSVELMTNRDLRRNSVIEFWVHNNNNPTSPSLLQENNFGIDMSDSNSTAVVAGSLEDTPGLFLLDQGHPWNVQLPESVAVFELGQTIPLRLLSSDEQMDHLRLRLVQKRTMRGKGIVGTSEIVTQELADIGLFTNLNPHRMVDYESERMDHGALKEEDDGTVVRLKLPSVPVLAPSTKTMYLDIEHSLVLSRMVSGSKTSTIVSEVPITIVTPRQQTSEQGTKAGTP